MEQREGTKRAEEYVASLGIRFEAKLVTDGGDKSPSVWRCIMERSTQGRTVRIVVPEYSMGAAYRTKPIAPDATGVLWSLVSDAECVRGDVSFEEFCLNLGYDTDSRKAEKAYLACRRELDELRRFGIDFEAAEAAFSDY